MILFFVFMIIASIGEANEINKIRQDMMLVDLNKEQVEFLDYLLFKVGEEYENYSAEEQKRRESMADSITDALEKSIYFDPSSIEIYSKMTELFGGVDKLPKIEQ